MKSHGIWIGKQEYFPFCFADGIMKSKLCKGEHISMKTLLRICRALHCDIEGVIALEQDITFAGGAERCVCFYEGQV